MAQGYDTRNQPAGSSYAALLSSPFIPGRSALCKHPVSDTTVPFCHPTLPIFIMALHCPLLLLPHTPCCHCNSTVPTITTAHTSHFLYLSDPTWCLSRYGFLFFAVIYCMCVILVVAFLNFTSSPMSFKQMV